MKKHPGRVYSIRVDRRIQMFIEKHGSVAVAIYHALRDYIDYLSRLDPNMLLEEIVGIHKINLHNSGPRINCRFPERLLEQLLPLINRYQLPLSGLANRALQYYIESRYGIRFEFDARRERKGCYSMDLNDITYKTITLYKNELDHIIKEYIEYFKSLDAKGKLHELSLIHNIADPSPRNHRISLYGGFLKDVRNMCKRYGLKMKHVILRAIEWHEENINKAPQNCRTKEVNKRFYKIVEQTT